MCFCRRGVSCLLVCLFCGDGVERVRAWLLSTPVSLQICLDNVSQNQAVGRQTLLFLSTRHSLAGQMGCWVGEQSPALLGVPLATPTRSAAVAS